MDISLAEKRALVCGASRGIGRACAIELARLGAEVILLAREDRRLESVREELSRGAGQNHICIAVDFNEPSRVIDVVGALTHPQKGIHILINNSGGPPGGALIEASLKEFQDAFTRHLFVSHNLTQLLSPYMKSQSFGRIINIVSTSVKQPIRHLGVSNTVRGAMASWAKTLAEELGPFGITVNNVLPGSTRTDRIIEIVRSRAKERGVEEFVIEQEMIAEIPAGRFADPREIGSVVAFLASPAAAYINGVNLPVDGGRTRAL